MTGAGIVLILIVISVVIVAFFSRRISSSPPLLTTHTLRVGSAKFHVEIADTMMKRATGLSGKERIADDEGMLFIFGAPTTQGFWMKDMKFPIDIIWIRGDSIIGFSERAVPEPGKSLFELTVYNPPEIADRVLEVNAGIVKRHGFRVGDEVVIE